MTNTQNAKILIINQFFFPDQTALSQVITDLAEGLVQNNYSVTVLTSKHFQLLDGEEKDLKINEIKIIRVGGSHFGKATTIGRLIDFLTFYFFVFIRSFFIEKHDIVFITTAPPLIGIVGVFLKKFRGFKFVYNIQDLYPHTAVQLGILKNKFLVKSLTKVLYKILYNADLNIVIGDDMAKKISSICPQSKILVIQNWDLKGSENNSGFDFREKVGLKGKFIVLYSGNFGLVHDFSTFLNGALLLKEYAEIAFVFIGEGKNKGIIEEFIRKNNLPNIVLLPFQKKSAINQIYESVDVGLVSLSNGLEGCIVPSKIYGLLRSGLPTLYVGNEHSEIANVINNANCGFTIKQGDSQTFSEKILFLYNNSDIRKTYSENAKYYFEMNFKRDIAIQKYNLALQEIMWKN